MKESLNKTGIPFTMVANAVLHDKRLSWKAKGLFAYIYSKPDDWDFNNQRIAQDGRDERKSVLSGLKELANCGYLVRKRLKTGRIQYIISYKPKSQNGTLPKRLSAEKGLIYKKENTTKIENKVKKNRLRHFSNSGEPESISILLKGKRLASASA